MKIPSTTTNNNNNSRPKIIFSKTRKIGEEYYFVEIKNIKNNYKIIFDNLETLGIKYQIEIPEKEAFLTIKNECENDYDKFVDRVTINEEDKTVFFKRSEII